MAEATQKARWNHTAPILAALYNWMRDPKSKPDPYTASDFNPFAPKKTLPVLPVECLGKLKFDGD